MFYIGLGPASAATSRPRTPLLCGRSVDGDSHGGVATADTLLDAWKDALECDSVSAFGGIVATNVPLDGPTANAICEIFTEVVVAPGASELIFPIAMAVQQTLTVADLAGTIGVYPSLSGSVAEAARRLMLHDDLD